MHPLISSYNTQEGELLRACYSDNCLFGQRETNATGLSLKVTQANRYDKLHYIPSVVFVVSEANLPLATCKVLGYIDPDKKGCHSEVAMLPIRCFGRCFDFGVICCMN